MESVSSTGSTIQLSENGNEVTLDTPDQSSKYSYVTHVNGNLIFDDKQTVLGINENKIEAYKKQEGNHIWKAVQVGTDATENAFSRISIDNKPHTGIWPFQCQKIIPCIDLPLQTCGCDHYIKGDEKKVVLVAWMYQLQIVVFHFIIPIHYQFVPTCYPHHGQTNLSKK